MSKAFKKTLGRVRDYTIPKMFSICQELGFHISLNNYYSPIPDTRALKANLWSTSFDLSGININEKGQLALLSIFMSLFKNEYDRFPKNKCVNPYTYYVNNPNFGSVDGEVLYCMIRYFKPKRIFEIGSGYSTYLSSEAIMKNVEEDKSYNCELVVFDPYPNETIKSGFPGLTRTVVRKVQDVPISEFQKLEFNDILFIDSSHTLKIGSDVQYEYLKILPKLNRGVIIHFHDIFLPAEYPKSWILDKHIFWNEQYLLQAFLTFNESYKVLWAGSYMHMKHRRKLEMAFNSFVGATPPSFYIKRER